ncbi:MAG: GntR family transcriptional regulator [Coprobacillaceae bacterium]
MEKYRSIATAIEQKIISVEYKPGEMLPDQNQLAKEYKTARVTIQKAVKILIREGLIYSKRGSGTYVKKNVMMNSRSFHSDGTVGTSKRIDATQNIVTKVISYDVRFPTEKESEILMIGVEQPIYDIIRLRIVDEEPLKLEHTILPVEVVPNLTKEILLQSIYDYLINELKLHPSGASRVIRASKSTDLDKECLKSDIHDPILEVEQIVYLENGTPIEYSTSRSRYDAVEYILHNAEL